MDQTVRHIVKVLGASGVESAGADARFAVDGAQGDRLRISVEGAQQRFMAVLTDSTGVIRTTVDVAPVSHATEDPAFPGRVTLHVGAIMVHIDTRPTHAIEVVSTR